MGEDLKQRVGKGVTSLKEGPTLRIVDGWEKFGEAKEKDKQQTETLAEEEPEEPCQQRRRVPVA
jgi:hypothetical protein